jgi:uncharacterized tellurite resistance protein B-like protein
MKFLAGSGLDITAEDLKNLTQDQNRAILESFLTSVAADGQVNQAELEALGATVEAYAWNFPKEQLEAEITAAGKALENLDPNALGEHFKQLGSRFPSAALREKAFAGMFALMVADGEFDQQEQDATAGFAVLFGIEDKRAAEILEGVVAAIKKYLGQA